VEGTPTRWGRDALRRGDDRSDDGADVALSFEIVVRATAEQPVPQWLTDAVGPDHVDRQDDGRLRVSVADQAAMVGVLNRLHDLGLEIESVGRQATNGRTS
jgi:hypothetical protein